MKSYWSVMLLLGVLVSSNGVHGKAVHCAKRCSTGYQCVFDDNLQPTCKMAPAIIATIVVACVMLVLLCPIVCIGMFFCGAFACMPKLFSKSVNRFLYDNKNGRVGRASYTVKKKRAEKAKKKKMMQMDGKKELKEGDAAASKADPENNIFAAQSFEQADWSGSSGKSAKSKSHSAYDSIACSTALPDDPV